MTLLFFNDQQLPAILGLVNLDLFADWYVKTGTGQSDSDDNSSALCLLPLSGINKIVVRSLMPLLALVFLLCIYALHQVIHSCMKNMDQRQSCIRNAVLNVYHVIFGGLDHSHHNSSPMTQQQNEESKSSSQSHSLNQPLLLSTELTSSSAGDQLIAHPVSSSKGSISLLPYFRTLVRIGVYGYNAVAVVSLSYFHCESVGDFGALLYDEPSISCNSGLYHTWLALFMVLLALVVIAQKKALS